MTYYSYPFNNLDIDLFWNCFDDLKTITIMDIKSNTLVNGKFSKATCYYKTGRFSRSWNTIPANNKEYVFQIGEHDNVHGHYVNIDLTFFLKDQGLQIPFQVANNNVNSINLSAHRKKTIHLPTVPYTNQDCWEILWGMIKGLRAYDRKSLESMGMQHWWDIENMHWVGPESIGHLKGLSEFQQYHQSKFLKFIPDRDGSKGINKIIFNQGNYAALMGCYSMTATHQGEYFNFQPEGGEVKPFVMDFWTCNGTRLVDNWCQIDMLDLWRNINKKFKSYIDYELKI